MLDQVILVDENDDVIGTAEKIAAHKQNLLHRAFSIFIFRDTSQRELLLQQRALSKYHCGGLWTNTCCSHPRPSENIIEAGKRRLQEEFGFDAELKEIGWFHYNAHFANGLSENENDHVLAGTVATDINMRLNPDEIHAMKWIRVEDLQKELAQQPEKFTPWLGQALEIALK